ncbi:MAG TPA: hypothetical protein VGC76_05625 [Pyrinomonadaceae bacterium]|jgi:hypothetical protein
MYSNIFNIVKKTAILLSLAFGIVLISDTTSQAQQNRYNRQGRVYTTDEYTDEGSQVAQQYGYEDGYQDGLDAGRERDAYHPENSGDWQKGTNGYEDRFGNKRVYKQAYRSAYLEGYKDGYKRYTNRTYTNARNYRKRY